MKKQKIYLLPENEIKVLLCLEKLDSKFAEICVSQLHKRFSDVPVAFVLLVIGNERKAVFNGMLFA